MIRSRAHALFSAIRRRLAGERGFTLVELLVTIVIIGLLAAIAYAVFLGQRTKAADAKAKDQAAAMTVDVESCFTTADTYVTCRTQAQLDDNALQVDTTVTARSVCTPDPSLSGDPYQDPDEGKIAVVGSSVDCYLIEAVSDDGHYFWVLKRSGGAASRTCAPPGQGGCVDVGSSTVGAWHR